MANKFKSLLNWVKSGSPWIWLTGGAVSISMLSVLGLMLLIGWKGLTYFWPAPLYQWQLDDSAQSQVELNGSPDRLIGQLYENKYIPIAQIPQSQEHLSEQQLAIGLVKRLSIKVANRELYPADFVSILDINLQQPTEPKEWAVI